MTRGLHSAVIWSWVLNVLRLASGVLLLPLLLHRLSGPDLGMYYLFLGLAAILPVLDAAFTVNVSRSVSFAVAGATNLRSIGITRVTSDRGPNRELLCQLLLTTRVLYRLLSLAVLVILATAGTWVVAARIHETDSPQRTWIAWAVTVAAAGTEIYSGWANAFLHGLNQVVLSARLSVLTYGLRLLIAITLLAGDAGLLSVPLATLFASNFQRFIARRACLKLLSPRAEEASTPGVRSLLSVLWPNSWRVGLKLLSMYVSANAIAYLCQTSFGLVAYGQYGLSLQIMLMIQGIAAVWTSVKWPLVAQLRSRGELAPLRQMLWPRYWLQNLTFIILALAAVGTGHALLERWGAGKQLLPVIWFALLGLTTFFEMQFAFWTQLLTTENRVPSLWATVITYPLGVGLVWLLYEATPMGIGAFVVGSLLAGSLFNYWYWPIAGARSLQTNWAAFLFVRSSRDAGAK